MTDTYGKDPHDHDDEPTQEVTGDADVTHEPPSDFEFSDEHGASVSGTDDLGEDGEIPVAEEAPARRSLLPIIAALSGVIILGGAGYWFMGRTTGPELPALTIGKPMALPVVEDKNKSTELAAIPTSPKMDSTSAMSPAEQIAAAQPLTSVQLAANAPPKPPAMVPNVQPLVPTLLTPATAIAALPPPVAAPVEPAPIATSLPAAIPVAAQPADIKKAPVAPEQAQRLDALNERMDSLQKSLDQVTQQLSQVTNMVAAGVSADHAVKPEQPASPRHTAPAVKAPESAPVDAAPLSVTAEPKAIHAKPALTAKKAAAQPTSKRKTAKPAESDDKSASTKWVLRAVTPDQVWVAPSATSRELRPVRVGDNLAGVGRITAITMEENEWVVRGTRGSLK